MTRDGRGDVAGAVRTLADGIPPALGSLAELAYNYRWAWTSGGADFASIDPLGWEREGGNPVRLLSGASGHALARAAADDGLVRRAAAEAAALREELGRPAADGPVRPERPIAFLCTEFGVHPSLPIYAGGLGVLAGDLLKEASDRAVPMVGVGLLYRQGYFHQRMDDSGWQHEFWFDADPERMPAALVTGQDGEPVTVAVEVRGRPVAVQIWRVDVGRTPLFLLDADRPENHPIDRWITSRLYIRERHVRLAQYALLGIGGIRALRTLGIEPGVVHLNEGHASLAAFELIREQVDGGVPFAEALERARSMTVFTTHTPVAAGNESYPTADVLEALTDLRPTFGADLQPLLELGRARPEDAEEPLGLTTLALRVSRTSGGVSRRHGGVARAMWQHLFPGHEVGEVPIGHVTNGVHLPTWMAPPMRALLERHLGPGFARAASDPAVWARVEEIPDEALWAVRGELRQELVAHARERAAADRLARGNSLAFAEAAARALDPDTLTLGFARRATAYKRIHLLSLDPERALGLLSDPHPIQLLLAGKPHPADEEGKRLIQRLFELRTAPAVADRVAFLEDYQMGMAAKLIAGCDVWLNLPRPPLEASGTSGMKAALNGGLNLSVLDGWWEEAYDGSNGWAIEGDVEADMAAQDARDAATLYDLLEREVVPLFHDRDERGIPRGWMARVKASLRTIGPRYCAARMLDDYVRDVYAAQPAGAAVR